MSRRTYVDYLQDIYEAAGYALSFVADVDLDTFVDNREKRFAKIVFAIAGRYADIPWAYAGRERMG